MEARTPSLDLLQNVLEAVAPDLLFLLQQTLLVRPQPIKLSVVRMESLGRPSRGPGGVNGPPRP